MLLEGITIIVEGAVEGIGGEFDVGMMMAAGQRNVAFSYPALAP